MRPRTHTVYAKQEEKCGMSFVTFGPCPETTQSSSGLVTHERIFVLIRLLLSLLLEQHIWTPRLPNKQKILHLPSSSGSEDEWIISFSISFAFFLSLNQQFYIYCILSALPPVSGNSWPFCTPPAFNTTLHAVFYVFACSLNISSYVFWSIQGLYILSKNYNGKQIAILILNKSSPVYCVIAFERKC